MNTKRCSGHKKHWECADEYPDHMVPVSEFHLSSTRGRSDGIQGMCKKCFSYSDKIRWKRRPKHPVTGEVKKTGSIVLPSPMEGFMAHHFGNLILTLRKINGKKKYRVYWHLVYRLTREGPNEPCLK